MASQSIHSYRLAIHIIITGTLLWPLASLYEVVPMAGCGIVT